MNAITANALATRRRKLPSIASLARKLGGLIAPRDHAGRGNWSKDSDIPWTAWPGGIALAAFFIWGWDCLAWLLHFVL
ncbi:hypothetical protein RAS12_00515 [Achromobacter seleniivolatilans]|uniref:Uncharacterized protein n=1 Tax=Achromobacter seleniivolatilans TaxID=3047478 RepID=A0ABY9M1K8_9BURK|nr:hypothetical protein [Achromobacter sp. R39]WMD20886.1 hypothetical protein RAS12_00515 [Achromobacter sp. R39]